MRRFGTISLLILVITLVFGSAVVAVTGTVNAPSGLVLREEASKTGAPLATVPDKTELEILEESGEWYRVTYNGQTGYIFGEFVNKNEETSVEPEVPAPEIPAPEIPAETDPNAVQAKSKIRVYIIPTVTSTVINEVEPNAQIHIEKQITNWSYIVSGNIQGWVRTYGIQNEIKTPEPTTPTVAEPEKPSTPEVDNPEQPETQEPETPTTNQPADNTNSGETAVESVRGFVIVKHANIRKEASTSSEIVTTLTKDTSFTITAETEEWYKISYTGLDGTVYVGYIYKNLASK